MGAKRKKAGKLKNIGNSIITLFLAFIFTSCNSFTSTPVISPTDFIKTATSIVETEAIKTQTAIPIIIPITYTSTPPIPTNIPPDTYADKIEYVTTKASEIIALFPYANETALYKVYSGCVETNDFQSLATYTIPFPEAPMEIIKDRKSVV